MLVKEYNYLCKFNSIDKEKLKMACQQLPPSSYLVFLLQLSPSTDQSDGATGLRGLSVP